MTDMPAALRRLAEHLRDGDPEHELLADGIDSWLRARGELPLDKALGLVPAPSRRSPHTNEALRLRAELIRQAAATHFAGLSMLQQAERLSVALSRYAASGWRHDRTRDVCPHAPGTLRAALWAILTAVPVPLGDRRIRAILAEPTTPSET